MGLIGSYHLTFFLCTFSLDFLYDWQYYVSSVLFPFLQWKDISHKLILFQQYLLVHLFVQPCFFPDLSPNSLTSVFTFFSELGVHHIFTFFSNISSFFYFFIFYSNFLFQGLEFFHHFNNFFWFTFVARLNVQNSPNLHILNSLKYLYVMGCEKEQFMI